MQEQRFFYKAYDLDSTSFKYGRYGPVIPMANRGALQTTGSSTTVTGTGSLSQFAGATVGSILSIKAGGGAAAVERKVATIVDSNGITVNSAIDLTTPTCSWSMQRFDIGTADTDGWIPIDKYVTASLHIDIQTVAAAGGVDLIVEGAPYGPMSRPQTIVPTTNYAAATEESYNISERFRSVRVGVKGGSGFAGTDVINVYLIGMLRS